LHLEIYDKKVKQKTKKSLNYNIELFPCNFRMTIITHNQNKITITLTLK